MTPFKKTADMLADFLSKQTPSQLMNVTVIILLEIKPWDQPWVRFNT